MSKILKMTVILTLLLFVCAPPSSAYIDVYDDGTLVGVAIGTNYVGSNVTLSGGIAAITLNDINSGTIDGAVIGGSTPAAGTFTTLTANTSLTLNGVTITTFDDVVSPWTNAGLTTTLNAAPGAVLATHATGVFSATGFKADTADIVLENDQIIDGGTNGSILLTEAGDTMSIAFSGNDIVLDTTDGGYIFTLTDATDGTLDIMTNNDADDYIQISTTGDQPSINFVGCDGLITADGADISFDDENLLTTGTLGAGATTVTSVIIGDDTIARAVDDIFTMTSNDEHITLKLISGAGGKDASLFLVADADANPADDWELKSVAADNDLHFINGTTLRLTMSSGGDILTTGSIQIPDDVNLIMGDGSDWTIQYDEAVDDQLLFVTTNTAAIAITDPMFEILVGTTPTANQQVFGVAKGTQGTNTPLLTLDEDGDLVIAGALTQTGNSQFVQDDTTDGVVTAITLVHSSNDNNPTNGDGVAISLHLENDANVVEEFGSIDVVSTDITDGAEDADIVFSHYTAGAIAETLRLTAASSATVSDYMTFTANTTETTVTHPVLILATATGTADTGHGVAISFQPEDATGSEELARLDVIQTDAIRASNDTDFVFTQNVAGALTETVRFDADLGVTLTSSVTLQPELGIINTNTDANAAVLSFRKDGEDEADGDDLGRINFYGNDSANNDVVFAYILAESTDITDTAEGGKISFQLEIADIDSAFLSMEADTAASTGHIDINSGAVDIDVIIDSNDQAGIVIVDSGSNDFTFTRDLAAANTDAAFVQIINTNVGDDQSALTIIQDATAATAALPAVSIQSTGNTDQASLLINHDSATGATGIAAVIIDSEDTDTAALNITSAVDASGTTQVLDDYALVVASEGVGGVASFYRNVDAATEAIVRIEDNHADATSTLVTMITDQDASAAADAVTIQATSVAFDKTLLFIDRDTTTGATLEPAVEIDSQDPDAAALLIRSPVDATGTDADFDDYVMAISAEGVGGGLHIHRNVSASTQTLVQITDDHADGTSPALTVLSSQDGSADDYVAIFTTSAATHDGGVVSVVNAGVGRGLFVDQNITTGVTLVPAAEIDSQATNGAALIVRAPTTLTGTDGDFDDFVMSVSAEGVGGALHLHRNVDDPTGPLLKLTEDNIMTTSSIPLLDIESDADASASTALVLIATTSVVNDQALMQLTQAGVTSTNFAKMITFNTFTLWVSDGTTAEGALTGVAGDIVLNGGTGAGQTAFCDANGTNWTDM